MTALIEIRDLLVQREKKTVLEIERLSVEAGEVLAIVGPNGAGKSTLFLALARLLKVARGTIHFDGTSSLNTLEYRRRIALVLQEPLLMDTSVKDNAAIGLRFRGIPKAEVARRVGHWLERLGVAHLAERPARKLLGGESQRVSLARAFVLQPELLLLDEPFTALDAPTRLRLLDDLQSVLAETSTTTIFITHDLGVIAQMASYVMVMYLGLVVEQGPVDDIFHAPKHPYTQALLRSIPSVNSTPRVELPTISGSIPHPFNKPKGCPFHPRCVKSMPGKCDVRTPALLPAGEKQWVSCFLYHDVPLLGAEVAA